MALIGFVANYEDMSTDRGYQFKFRCDKCGNGFMTQFKPSTLGMAQSLLNVAGSFLGGMGNFGNAAYEVQRAVGGKVHDAAFAEAVEEARPSFRQCTKCGKWVCGEVCWNAKANQCEECAPDFHEHLASNQAQAKAEAAREQLHLAARSVNYSEGIDMSADSYIPGETAATNVQPKKITCTGCGAELGPGTKFCGECGQAVAKAGPKACAKCGTMTESKFCPECGGKM
jgi:RNA polymerase subunit RPABC4/transcription elongation factor Spt4